MELFEVKSTGIFNSQIFRSDTKISDVRTATTFEIELPLEEGGVSYMDEESRPITPSTLICAKPGQRRQTKFPFKCYHVHLAVSDEEIRETAMRLPNFIRVGDREEYIRIFKSIIKHENEKGEADRYAVCSRLLQLLSLLLRESESASGTSTAAPYSSYVETAIGYIDDHLCEELSLARVAYAVSLSPVYFHSVFKAATGQTLHDYVEEKRIRQAVYLMQTTDRTLAEIAYACGFSSQSYFSYAFKRRTGSTPRSYIHQLNGGYGL